MDEFMPGRIGIASVDAGLLARARLLGPLAMLKIKAGYMGLLPTV